MCRLERANSDRSEIVLDWVTLLPDAVSIFSDRGPMERIAI